MVSMVCIAVLTLLLAGIVAFDVRRQMRQG